MGSLVGVDHHKGQPMIRSLGFSAVPHLLRLRQQLVIPAWLKPPPILRAPYPQFLGWQTNPHAGVLLPSSTPEVLLDSLSGQLFTCILYRLSLSNKEGFCNLSSVSHLSKLWNLGRGLWEPQLIASYSEIQAASWDWQLLPEVEVEDILTVLYP